MGKNDHNLIRVFSKNPIQDPERKNDVGTRGTTSKRAVPSLVVCLGTDIMHIILFLGICLLYSCSVRVGNEKL